MPFYKDQEGKPHFLDSERYEHLLPFGCVQIDEKEAERLAAEVTKKMIAEQEAVK